MAKLNRWFGSELETEKPVDIAINGRERCPHRAVARMEAADENFESACDSRFTADILERPHCKCTTARWGQRALPCALLAIMAVTFLASPIQVSAQTKPLYENNFEKAEVGKVPDDFLVIDGAFAVKEENGNKVLELPGAPLDTFNTLFGPTTNANVQVSARIFGTGKGRRYPTFAVGLNGAGGYRLQVSPAKKAIELYKGDSVLTSKEFDWKSGEWTQLKLQVRKAADGKFKVESKAWKQGEAEPKDWTISFDETTTPANGRASVWGSPYSGTPIQFDDLKVTSVSEN